MSIALAAIGPEIWTADGPPVRFFGFPYPTRMTIVRLPDNALWICSPTALDDAVGAAIAALGTPRWLIAPNLLHHLFLAPWQHAWPAARLHAVPALRRRRRDLRIDADLGPQPDPAWADAIDQVVFGGSLLMDEVVFFHRRSRSAVVTDLIQRFDPGAVRGWRGWLMRLDGLVGPDGSTPREWRITFRDRAALRRARDAVLAWQPQRVIIAHGACITEDAPATLARAFAWMG
jgi:hypothetical protein